VHLLILSQLTAVKMMTGVIGLSENIRDPEHNKSVAVNCFFFMLDQSAFGILVT